jgi:hypothetical protein
MSHRLPAALLTLVLATSGATRGLCFMPGTGEPGPRDAHGCCKKGWTSGAPECCMEGAPDDDPGRLQAVVAHTTPETTFVRVAPPARVMTLTASAPRDRSHSPPGRAPLRI